MTDTPKPCPVCGKPAQMPHTPFCSARCKKVDLHRWLGEVYKIETPDSSTTESLREDEE